jgi:hypothetical protein
LASSTIFGLRKAGETVDAHEPPRKMIVDLLDTQAGMPRVVVWHGRVATLLEEGSRELYEAPMYGQQGVDPLFRRILLRESLIPSVGRLEKAIIVEIVRKVFNSAGFWAIRLFVHGPISSIRIGRALLLFYASTNYFVSFTGAPSPPILPLKGRARQVLATIGRQLVPIHAFSQNYR